MTIEEAIETIEYARAFNEKNTLLMKAWDLIIDYVRAQSANDGQMKSDGWISVKDRIPDKTGDYLAFVNNDDNWFIEILRYIAKPDYSIGFYSYDNEDGAYFLILNVTHWMPLPEPPEGDEEDDLQ